MRVRRESDEALGRLCAVNWPPLYAYVPPLPLIPACSPGFNPGVLAAVGQNYLREMLIGSGVGFFASFLLAALKHSSRMA